MRISSSIITPHTNTRKCALGSPLGRASICYFTPTYASWLNPVERLWRWLRQDVLHCHPFCDDLQQLRDLTAHWLDRFQNGSRQLLYFIGLLTAEELNLNAC